MKGSWLYVLFVSCLLLGMSQWTVTGEKATAPSTLQEGVTYTIGALFTEYRPIYAVGWADIDGDGDLDVSLNDHLYENDGDGNYSHQWSAPEFVSTTTITSTLVRSTAWGDCDGDGDLDFAVGADGTNYIYRNVGQFDLSTQWVSTVQRESRSMQWGDSDGDGNLDLAVGNYDTANQLYINGGACTFGEQDISAENNPTTSLAWADANGDGSLDLAIGNTNWANVVMLNNGSGGFSEGWNSADTEETTSLAWGDMDADGDFDLVVGNTSEYSLNGDFNELYRNDGSGTFSKIYAGMDGRIRRTESVDIGDLDLDGDLDIVVGNKDQFNDVYYNDGSGQFTLVWESPDDGRFSHHVVMGDGDNDGDLDLLSGNNEDAQLYLNESNNGWSIAHQLAPNDSNYAMAWGDIDRDGDLDLALGNGKNDDPNGEDDDPPSEPNFIYINDGTGVLTQLPFTTDLQDTHALAWGDADGDGDLDLAVGNVGAPNQLYRNDGNHNFTILQLGAELDPTYAVAWGDADGDGDLDLVVGNQWASNYLYINLGDLNFDTPIIIGESYYENTKAMSWGDMDGDGDLDLAVANHRSPNRIYANIGNSQQFEEVWASAESSHTTTIEWGDADGDGDLDLAVGNERATPNELYTNNGNNHFTHSFISTSDGDVLNTYGIRWGDSDNDGDLDLAVANGHPYVPQVNQVFKNDGEGNFVRVWESADNVHRSYAASWVDVDNDGDLDLSFGNRDAATQILENKIFAVPLLAENHPTIAIDYPSGNHAMAMFYATDIITSSTITIPYRLFDRESEVIHQVNGFYSMDGGDNWRPALPTPTTVVTDLISAPTGASHTFVWDTFRSGFFGQSDQVVFRLEIVLHAGGGSYAYANRVSYPHQRATVATATQTFRVQGTQVQVVDETNTPRADAIVVRVANGTSLGDSINNQNGMPFTTNVNGDLQGRGTVGLGDRLVAMLPITETNNYTAYHLSSSPSEDGLAMHTVTEPGRQMLQVSVDNSLLIFDLSVSLEWDARNDEAYLNQLASDLRRASEILYDLTNGQAILGDVTVYHEREQWNQADLVIHASNAIRPSAIAGGVVTAATDDVASDSTVLENAYVPGQMRMGATWNRFGEADSLLGEDWPRTLAHELGHYLFFLPDNYLGIDPNSGLLSLVDCVGSAMTDPYSDAYSDFLTQSEWDNSQSCSNTLAEVYMGRGDWETIHNFYPMLNSITINTGPSYLPLNLTQVRFVDPSTPTNAIVDPFFNLVSESGSQFPIANGRGEAFLIKTQNDADPTNDYVQPLGSSVGSLLRARGAATGDRLCVYDFSRTPLYHGCLNAVGNFATPITMRAVADWQPEIHVTEVNSQTFGITVTNVTATDLMVQLLPTFGAASAEIAMNATGGDFTQTITLPEPAFAGHVRIWVSESDPSKEMIVDFISIEDWGGKALSWGGKALSWGGKALSWGGKALSWGAPTMSSDGQVSLFPLANPFVDTTVYNLQKLSFLPTLDSWLAPVGQAYRVDVAGDMPASSIIFRYLGRDVDRVYENDLAVYFSADNGQTWQRLTTVVDENRNHAVAPANAEGIYLLALTINTAQLSVGWNNDAYIVQTTRPVTVALASIEGAYTSVYWHDDDNPGTWLLYDSTVNPPFGSMVNTLEWIGPEAYWIYATQPVRWYIGIEGHGEVQNNSRQTTPNSYPPATYYGWIDASGNLSVGATMSAWIDGNLCGETTVVEHEGQLAYSIQVMADDFWSPNGCGIPDRPIELRIDDLPIATTTWGNSQANYLPLTSLPTSVGVSANHAAHSVLPTLLLVSTMLVLTTALWRHCRKS